ncbi:MAG TPA: DUF1028 domain-containing protein [Nitrososphaerales archaeon]|nr:DUF1028 domain-containing protein [Nitrososphaerales archaeon]
MTFSIVARDKKTGELGVAVQSHWFSVGSVVSWARAGVGAVATQSMAEISYGPLGLELMSSGKSARDSLDALLRADKNSETRQVAMVDRRGTVAVHTGNKCIPFAGHTKGEGFSCQANLMINDTIWNRMATSFRAHSSMQLPERLIAALEAGQKAGGDVRGKQSAAILVVSKQISPNQWSGRLVDLRVEDHPNPIPELKRLLRVQRGYEWANKGDEFLTAGKFGRSLDAYRKASHFAPDLEELQFWQAVSLVQSKRLKDAKPIFRKVFKKNKNWILVLKSLPRVGLMSGDPDLLQTILD